MVEFSPPPVTSRLITSHRILITAASNVWFDSELVPTPLTLPLSIVTIVSTLPPCPIVPVISGKLPGVLLLAFVGVSYASTPLKVKVGVPL